jgi:hypothetical protein
MLPRNAIAGHTPQPCDRFQRCALAEPAGDEPQERDDRPEPTPNYWLEPTTAVAVPCSSRASLAMADRPPRHQCQSAEQKVVQTVSPLSYNMCMPHMPARRSSYIRFPLIGLLVIAVLLLVLYSQQRQRIEQQAASINAAIQHDPLAQQTYLDQSSYFQTYGFITSIDTMKITRDRSFPGLAQSVIISDVNDFTAQMPNANTITDDVYLDNTVVFREWADAIHAKGKHVWFRGHLCQWESCPGYTHNTDPANYTKNLIIWLNNTTAADMVGWQGARVPCEVVHVCRGTDD